MLKHITKQIKNGFFNIGTEVATSINDLAQLMSELSDHQQGIFYGPPLDGDVEIIVDFGKKHGSSVINPVLESEIIVMLKRRPCTASDISDALSLSPVEVEKALKSLVFMQKLSVTRHEEKNYYSTW